MTPRMCALARWAGLSLALLLTACATSDATPRDRFRAVRGDSPPRPGPALQIANPPTALLAAASGNPQPAPAPLAPAPAAPVPPAPKAPPTVQPASYLPNPETSTAGSGVVTAEATAPAADPLRDLHAKAAARWQTLDSYIVRLRRREVVAGNAQPEELMLQKFRKEPMAVYFKWVGEQAKGRECIYVPSKYDGKIQTRLAAGDVILMPAGARFAAAPDSPMVRSRCRYPITDSGFGTTIRRFGNLVEAQAKGDTRMGTIKHLGKVQRPEYEQPVDDVVQHVPAGAEPLMPQGGERHWYFDQRWNLPLLVTATDARGHEVEYYCYDRLEFPVRLDDDDFNPDRLWNSSSGASRARSAP